MRGIALAGALPPRRCARRRLPAKRFCDCAAVRYQTDDQANPCFSPREKDAKASSAQQKRPSMTETAEAIKIQRGLKGVYFDRSPCTFIDGKAGELRYRGYSIHDLAEHSTFEETAWLLLNGELPNKQQLASFRCRAQGRAQTARAGARHHPRHQICASDGRVAHGCLRAGRFRSGNGRQFARGDPAQGRAADLAGADDRRRAFAHPHRSGAGGGGRKRSATPPICSGC